jgi:hypothetical protein
MNKLSIDASNKIAEFRKTGQKQVDTSQNAPESKPNPAVSGQNDKVDFSGRAGEAAKLSAYVATLPDIRSEVVAHYRELNDAGKYNPRSFDIAAAILAEEV